MVSGIELVAEAVGLAGRARRADLVMTGEGAFDFSSRAGKVVLRRRVGRAAAAARPCIVLAGQVLVGSREMRALGVESRLLGQSTWSAIDASDAPSPHGSLAALAERVARTLVA